MDSSSASQLVVEFPRPTSNGKPDGKVIELISVSLARISASLSVTEPAV
jgi:hypothetical protein